MVEEQRFLTWKNGVFVWIGGFKTKDVPKAAGFLWHGGNRCRDTCKACKAQVGRVWWTKREAHAARIPLKHADKEARRALAKHVGTVAASKAADAIVNIPSPEGLEYLPYQKAGISYAMGRQGTLIADEMGLGKTIQALGVVNADSEIKRVLTLCPASLRTNWLRESQKWLTREFSFFVMEKTTDRPAPEDNFVIVNYDKLARRGGKDVLAALMSLTWDCIICDEAHFLKNSRTQRAKAVLGYWDKKAKTSVKGLFHLASKRQLLLTGTPILNSPLEIQGLLGALVPKEFGYFMSFAKRYCGAYQEWIPGKGDVWNFDGATNLEELQERARGLCMIRRLKKDVLSELPPKRRQIICLPPNGAIRLLKQEQKQWSQYDESLEKLKADVQLAHASGDGDDYKRAVQALHKAEEIAFLEMSGVRYELALAKVDKVLEHVDLALESLGKVVLFAHHRDVVKAFTDHWRESCVSLIGDTPMKARQAAVDRFQSDPACKVFVGTIGAAGVGLTLTAASLVVFAELDWVPANITQAEDRLHRYGQKNHVLVQHLVIDGSLDSKMAKILVEKQEIADQALDLGTEVLVDLPPQSVLKKEHTSKYPPATEAQREAAAVAMQFLAGICDGARALDGRGFSAFDVKIGHSLAEHSLCKKLTDGQVWLASKLAHKYRRQLSEEVLAVLVP
jgi:SWI/SNF-related matrix-associated actin-dependent regulator 1 of chromatin subfamily A